MGAPGPLSSPQGGQWRLGQQLVLPGDLTPSPEASALSFQTELASNAPPPTRQPRTYAEVAAQPPNTGLQAASYVYVRHGSMGPPLASPYAGPYKVLQAGPKYFVLEVGGRQEVVTVDRLKPHSGDDLAATAELPRRGRPPRHPPSPSPACSSVES
jgi:hypothetical protein